MIKEQFTSIFKNKNALNSLVSCLTQEDLCELGTLNSWFRDLIMPFTIQPKKAKSQKQKPSNAPKNQNPVIEVTITDHTYKLETFTTKTAPKALFSEVMEKWKYTSDVPEKLWGSIERSSYIAFKSKVNDKDMFFIHRAFVDRRLEFYRGDFDDEEEENYTELFNGTQFTDNVDFTSPEALRVRQKHILGLLNDKEMEKQTKEQFEFEKEVEKIKDIKRISIILCFGGSFSLAIYEGDKCILHKSDKKYVIRGKAGGRQLNKDKSSGSNIQSMGSQIRRHQEKLHQENVSGILEECEKDLQQSDIIFLQAPGLNRKIIIEGSEALCRLKHKLRSVCYSARKANFQNVEEVHDLIKRVFILRVKE